MAVPVHFCHRNSVPPAADLPSVLTSVGAFRNLGASRSSSFLGDSLALAVSDADATTLGPHCSVSCHSMVLPANLPRMRRLHRCRASQCGKLVDLKGHRWRGRAGKRWQQRSVTTLCMNSGQNPPGDDNFWEQAEDGTVPEEKASSEEAQKFSEELARRAKEQAERRKQAEQMFQLGQRAYGRGVYDKAVEFLEASLTIIPGASNLGGEVQVWLAMAYEANNKHKECIALYKKLETTHPSRSVRKQAKDLRFILEAPKLKISKEEMVSIPLLDDNDSDTRTWSKMYRAHKKKTSKKVSPTRDYLEDWLVWKPPRWERSPYFWVAATVWLTLVGISLMFQD